MHPGPCLVFLDPAKKGLRYPNLKSKTSLLLQLKLTVTSSHQSHQHHLSLQSVLLLVNNVDHLLITLINTAATHFSIFSVHQHLLFNTAKSSRSAHLCCCWSTAHQHCSSSLLLPHCSSTQVLQHYQVIRITQPWTIN